MPVCVDSAGVDSSEVSSAGVDCDSVDGASFNSVAGVEPFQQTFRLLS